MRQAVICAAVRTPVGRRRGGLSEVHAVDLGAAALRGLVERTGVDPALVDDVHWGCVTQVGEQAFCVGRQVVLAAGWPESVPAVTVDRQCGSSQQALHQAAAAVVSGQADVVVAGGAEAMTRVPMGANFVNGPGEPFGPAATARYAESLVATGGTFNQGLGAELIAAKWGLSRSRLDEFSLASHARAARAQDSGRFADEIVPVALPGGGTFTTDEGVRRDSTPEAMAGLRPAFRPDGVITAGNSSQISDGAAALLVTTPERAGQLGLTPIVRVAATAVAGDDPVVMLTAPIPATARLLRRAGVDIAEIGAFEVNEAFASVPLAWLAETGADPDRLNPLGGAIALGHPLGASGARLTTTLVHHMRREGIRYGLQTMCEGGGMANATLFELV
ncbi:acetyl-CoA acyltransferase [Longimycelium tulufanense]|uniref:Acetyl-CoA acyltransferase n=1 Tax=Longimycelium tulufanense TaxID=907463 RepID=A0A8J3CJH3_9PSEU|nr:thiolase family protein [Longimycelium tulufanense]GGM78037.1 acetyl-CoA acyltransferase [Longimycelium tulufanense]